MQKDLKILDKELANNQLIRIPDISNKHDQSLFRALSASVYLSHTYASQVKLDIRLALACNLSQRKHNPYPPLNQPNILQKYVNQPSLVMDFWQKQELQCFQNDNLWLASAVFGMQICLYTIDKEEYLNQTYIIGCKNPRDQRINLAKIGKRYYSVLETEKHLSLKFIKQFINSNIIGNMFQTDEIFDDQQKKENIPNTHKLKQHKKSLSQCRQLSQKQIFPQEKHQRFIEKQSKQINSPPFQQLSSPLPNPNQLQHTINNQTYQQNSINQNYGNYYSYNQYNHYMIGQEPRSYMQEQYQQNYNYVEPTGPINGQRYAGRLKFFDQSGNYGFLVIDNLNTDLFVHFDDLSKAGLSKQKLLTMKTNYDLRFQFTYYQYQGKQHKKSKKAIDLQLTE